MKTYTISGNKTMECINKDLTYNRGLLMKLASKEYRFAKKFNKSVKWGDVLKAVWGLVTKLMKSCRLPKKEVTVVSISTKTNLIY